MPFDSLRTGPVKTRVWSAGRLILLVMALGMTYGVFFLGAMRVANRAREVKVPDVRGKSIADAAEALTNAGLVVKVDPVRRADSKIAAEHVLVQEPDPGSTLRRQRVVRLRISDGLRAPEIPSVIGQTERTAEIALAQSHIDVAGKAEVKTSDYDTDTIIAQDPPAKARGPAVTLLVNHGAAGASYVMPDLIGTFGKQVELILRARGFRVTTVAEVVYPGIPPNVVVSQTPKAGFQIAPGEAISIEVSK